MTLSIDEERFSQSLSLSLSFSALTDLSQTFFGNRARNCWFLVPIFAPFLGAIVGVMVYQLMVGFHVEGEVRDRIAAEVEETVKLNDVTTTKEAKDGTVA